MATAGIVSITKKIIHNLCDSCWFCLITHRYGGRYRDDRSHRGYDDRQKPATEYGSRGYYEFFY